MPNRITTPEPTPRKGGPPRALLLMALVAACLLASGGYVTLAAQRARTTTGAAPDDAAGASSLVAGPHIVFRSTAPGADYGRVGVATLAGEAGPRTLTTLRCARTYLAAGRGICLNGDPRIAAAPSATIFDSAFRPGTTLPLTGLPSRARISPDGRYAATTTFVNGDSYAAVGFSTRTTLIDAATGSALVDLEEFTAWRDGARFQAPDFNFWGVTFARDSNHFYATLATAGMTYLVEGDVAARTARVLHQNVECPSLSPDGTRIAYKQLVRRDYRTNAPTWRLAVLDLATLTETPLEAEHLSVDDQVEWLDDSHILYALQDYVRPADPAHVRPIGVTNLWALPVDGGTPRLFLTEADSPAVGR
jgi:hypothetical protein